MLGFWQIFKQFLMLGCTSFGGPAAHIGYFRQQFVVQKKWLDEQEYGQLVALSQFLPGPGSSQVGFALGHRQGKLPGAIAAFLGFTLPSFLLMYCLSVFGSQDIGWLASITHGLKLMAVVIVADAVIGMHKSFCKSGLQQFLFVATAAVMLIWPGAWVQLLVLVAAAALSMVLSDKTASTATEKVTVVRWPLVIVAIGFFVLPLLSGWPVTALLSDFFKAGSLVFGGGHVVLPLLQASVGEAVGGDRFLMGYAGAQAIPGPMFTFAAFLGAELMPQASLVGAVLAVAAIFLPGFLLVLALQSGWQSLNARPPVAAAVAGINAAVVGLLLAALYQPVFVSAVMSPLAMAAVIVGYAALVKYRPPILLFVAGFAVFGWLVL